jgi:hypothetical protein
VSFLLKKNFHFFCGVAALVSLRRLVAVKMVEFCSVLGVKLAIKSALALVSCVERPYVLPRGPPWACLAYPGMEHSDRIPSPGGRSKQKLLAHN